MVYDPSLDTLLQKVWDGGRITPPEAERLYALPLRISAPLPIEGASSSVRPHTMDAGTGSSPISSTATSTTPTFATSTASSARLEDGEGRGFYVISHEEMDRKIEETLALGGTQILMQGGHHPSLTKEWYLDLLRHIRTRFPTVNVHGFSPSEFIHFQEVFQEPVEPLLREFAAAGLGSLPGGGRDLWTGFGTASRP